jgi:hypothetical protein
LLIRARASVLMLFLGTLCIAAVPAVAEVALDKDLTAVILLLGLPCGQVASAQLQAENDYVALCTDGNRYRVFVNAEGRVVAEKQAH